MDRLAPEFLEVAPIMKLRMIPIRRKLLGHKQSELKEAVVAATILLQEFHNSMEAESPEVSAVT